MPLKLNVGLSRKIGQANFGSLGASVHVELEADSSLARDPDRLQEKIRRLFGLVRSSLDEELHRGASAGASAPSHRDEPRSDASVRQSPAKPGANKPARPATPSQVKTLYGIAREQRLDLANLLQQQFQVGRPEDLTLPQASQLLDTLLKTPCQPA